MTYYEILKQGRIDYNSNASRYYSPYHTFYPPLLKSLGVDATIETELDLLGVINTITQRYIDTSYDSPYIHILSSTNVVSIKYSEYGYCGPYDIFSMYPARGTVLPIIIIELLKKKYNISDYTKLFNHTTETTSVDSILKVTRDLILNNNEFYGFYYPIGRSFKIKSLKPINVYKFIIIKNNFIDCIKNTKIRTICNFSTTRSNPISGYYPKTDLPESNIFEVMNTKTKKIIPIVEHGNRRDRGWVFSLNEEHLRERIEYIKGNITQQINQEVDVHKHNIAKLKSQVNYNTNQINELSKLLKKYNNIFDIWKDF